MIEVEAVFFDLGGTLIHIHQYSSFNKLYLYFHGGEPLLSFSLIKRIIDYVNDKGWQDLIRYTIQTNGILLDRKILSYIKYDQPYITVKPNSVKVKDQKKRWASCNP